MERHVVLWHEYFTSKQYASSLRIQILYMHLKVLSYKMYVYKINGSIVRVDALVL